MYRPFKLGQPFGANLPGQPGMPPASPYGVPAPTGQQQSMGPFWNQMNGASWEAASPEARQRMLFDSLRRNRMGGSNR